MIKSLTTILIVCFLVDLTWTHDHHNHKNECLILILVDGVRWDYMKETSLNGFEKIATHGVKAEYVDPIFPSNSYPNWYTIVTGRYAESHGFVQNFMYDEKRNDYFRMAPDSAASHPHWWNYTEPIWITAEKSHIKTGMYWWDGCQVEIRGTKVTSCQPYIIYNEWNSVKKEKTEAAFNEVLKSCKTKERRLALLYYEAVDANGHKYGPDSPERKDALKEVDSVLQNLQGKMEEMDLQNQINLVIVSDHGMANSNPATVKNIVITDAVDLEDIKLMLDRGSMSMILPAENKLDKVYDDLKKANIEGLHVYKKEEIPDHYHFKKHRLVLPILLTADQGYFITAIDDEEKMVPYSSKQFMGFHGYDPHIKDKTDMRGIFYARGPSFKTGIVHPALQMVDHYNILCHLLEMQGLPNNGSWDRVKDMFENNGNVIVYHYQYLLLVLAAIYLLQHTASIF